MSRCELDDDQLLSNTTEKLILARGYTAAATLAVSLVLFSFALGNLVRKYARFHKECLCCFMFLIDYFTNPFLLLALISLLPVATYWLILLRYSHLGDKNRLDDDDFCKVPGYLLLWFESSETLALAVLSLYFLFYYIPFHNKRNSMLLPREREEVKKKKRGYRAVNNAEEEKEYKARVPRPTGRYWYHSIASVLSSVAVVVICGLYTCPYFVKRAGPSGSDEDGAYRYGVEGPWCWIKPKSAQKDFWFYEEWMFMGVSLIALVSSLFVLLCVTRSQGAKFRICHQTKWDKTILVPFGIFLFYFALQFTLMAVEVLVRICDNSNEALWFTYAIGKPLSKVLLVVAALQLMSTSYRMGGKREGETQGLLASQGPNRRARVDA